jgi:hypothetical protein
MLEWEKHMSTSRSLANLACFAVLAAATAACSTQRTADDIAMQRAYEHKVAVTGSRIRRKVDPETGMPNAAYPTVTIQGDSAGAVLRNVSRPASAQN